MLKEALQQLATQAVAASGPHLELSDPTKIYAVRAPDGTVSFIGGRVPWRKHTAKDLETIAAFAERFQANGGNSGSSIWYSRDKVVLLTNDAERFDRVTLDMLKSHQITTLVDLGAKRPLMPQRDFLFMLRTTFTPDAFPTAPKMIDCVRAIKFDIASSAEGNLQRGKSSVGKSLQAAATGLEAVPDQITVSVPIFDNAFMRKSYDVRCAMEIYEQEQKLQLFPLPGQVEYAFAAAEADLCQAILDLLGKSTTVPVYYGAP